MNALLVDDERLARRELRRLLVVHPDVTVVGEAATAEEAEARLRELPVDMLFLDIKMPGATGFDLLERLERVPLLVFTTAARVRAPRLRGQRLRLSAEADPAGPARGRARQDAHLVVGSARRRGVAGRSAIALGVRPRVPA